MQNHVMPHYLRHAAGWVILAQTAAPGKEENAGQIASQVRVFEETPGRH